MHIAYFLKRNTNSSMFLFLSRVGFFISSMDNKLACNVLNSYYQKNNSKFSKPEYLITTSQANGRYQFTATCKFNNHEEKATAFSKQEAKRLSACLMLMYLNNQNPSVSSPTSIEITSSEEIREINPDELKQMQNDAINTYLKQRVTDVLYFNQLFTEELENNLSVHFSDTDNGFKKENSPKSRILNNLLENYEELQPSENTPLLFELILREMNLQYSCEFVETKVSSQNILLIKINLNLIAAMGKGNTPSEAIFNACLEAIRLLCVFNL